MEPVSKEAGNFSEKEIFMGLKDILYEVAPLKIVGEVTPEKSLAKDFAFDSIDTMGMLLKVQERFLQNRSVVDVDQFVNRAFKGNDGKSSTVKRICALIGDIINGNEKGEGPDGKEN